MNSIKAIIRCVEDHKLESEFPLDSLRKRAASLEKTKADRKKSSSAANKPQNKRAYTNSSGRGGGSSSLRPSKAAKYSNVYPSFSRRNTNPPPHHSPAARYSAPYNYLSHVYEASNAVPYASTYGVSHAQSSATAIPQQHYSLPGDIGAAAYRTSGSYSGQASVSYGGQASYGSYDYANAASSTTPSSYLP